MLKLYGGKFSRASIVQWYLEELEVPYEFVQLDMQAGEHRQPEFLAVNPFGKVPALVDGDLKLFESGAILLHLSRRYGPPLTLAQEATVAQWVLFANATLGPEVFNEAIREKTFPRLVGTLNSLLAESPYLAGEFSAADVAVASVLAYIPMMLKLGFDDYPNVAAYLRRLAERPGFQRSFGARMTTV